MSISVLAERQATSGEWDAMAQSCAYATYFHTRAWAQLWARYTNGAMVPEPRLLTFSDGATALLALTQSSVLGALARTHWWSPAGTYGGWLATDTLTAEHAALIYAHVRRRCRSLSWRSNPFDPVATSLANCAVARDTTQVIWLDGGMQAVNATADRCHRRAVKRALGAGVTVRPAVSSQDWQDYFETYRLSLRRWGSNASSRYEWPLFELVAAERQEHVRLWLAIFDGRVAAGVLCFYWRDHAVAWHGAGRADCFAARPANLLYQEILADACERDCRCLDLNPSGGHEGVHQFKRRLGAVELSAPVLAKPTRLSVQAGRLVALRRRILLLGSHEG